MATWFSYPGLLLIQRIDFVLVCLFVCLFVCFLNNSALIDFSILNFRTLIFVISQAAMNGFWVVFEGIDKAPSDVQSILLPLLEGASSFLTSHGEVITLYLLPTCYVAHF